MAQKLIITEHFEGSDELFIAFLNVDPGGIVNGGLIGYCPVDHLIDKFIADLQTTVARARKNRDKK